VPKPWGSTDLRPWNAHHDSGAAIGELWFGRSDPQATESALLLKLLFTTAPLSIQVHPNDSFASSIGLPRGKCEAWYILSATPDAQIGLGLKQQVSPAQLRASIDEGSISDLVHWRSVRAGDVVFVPAGAIHSIGPGVVLAEIQQRSNTTFRLFDYGRQRELDATNAVAAASTNQAEDQTAPRRLSAARTLLVASPHFVLEYVEFPSGAIRTLFAVRETWLFALYGGAWISGIDAHKNEVVFLEADNAHIEVGPTGLRALIAYVGSQPDPLLIDEADGQATDVSGEGRGRRSREPLRSSHVWSLGSGT